MNRLYLAYCTGNIFLNYFIHGSWPHVNESMGVPFSFALGSIYAYEQNQVRLAHKIKENMPLSVIEVIQSHTWHGGPLINLKDNTTRPTAEELCLNFMWLLPIVKECPNKAGFQCLICKAHLKLSLTALPTKTVKGVEPTTVWHWFCSVDFIFSFGFS